MKIYPLFLIPNVLRLTYVLERSEIIKHKMTRVGIELLIKIVNKITPKVSLVSYLN